MLSEDNIERYAFVHFTDRVKTEENFKESFQRLQTIRKHFLKYIKTGDINCRLMLNHIIILFNSFTHEAALNMLFYECSAYHSQLKTVLLFCNRLPSYIVYQKINTLEIPLDKLLMDKLHECC